MNPTLAILSLLCMLLPAIPACEQAKPAPTNARGFIAQKDPKGLLGFLTKNPAAIKDAPVLVEAVDTPDAKGSLECLKVLLKFKPDLDVKSPVAHGGTALHRACRVANLKAAELLIKAGADLNATDDAKLRPLHIAASSGQLEMVRLLLDGGAEVNFLEEDTTKSLPSLARDFPEVTKLLQSAGMRFGRRDDSSTF